MTIFMNIHDYFAPLYSTGITFHSFLYNRHYFLLYFCIAAARIYAYAYYYTFVLFIDAKQEFALSL